jgi:hypothetical protein
MFQFTASTDFFVGNYLYAHLYLSNFYVLKLDEFQYTHICMLTYIKRKGQEKMFRRFSTQPVPIFFSRIICMLNITLHCTIITEPLNAKDEYSFSHTPINSEEDWQALLNKTFTEAENFASFVEKLPELKLFEDFTDEKYGNYYRNIHGIIEHTHYHLGQIVLIKKLLIQNNR